MTLSFCVGLLYMQKVLEGRRDRDVARKALEDAIKSPVNKAIGPSYRKLNDYQWPCGHSTSSGEFDSDSAMQVA